MSSDGSKKVMFTTEEYDTAFDLMDTKPVESAKLFTAILLSKCTDDSLTVKWSRMQEECIYNLGKIYAKQGDLSKVKQLMVDIRPFFQDISKPRGAKILRSLIDTVSDMGNNGEFVITLCKDSIQWCVDEKRSFLKQRLEARLATLLCVNGDYKTALQIIRKVKREVKKLDDKPLMVELDLTESTIFYKLGNVAKAKGALTAARSNANAFYCSPIMLAEIDMQAGMLSGAENDFRTGFSYFYEAYEGYNSNGKDGEALSALKYMMLCKVMANQASDVYNIINSKAGLKHVGKDVAALKSLADAYVAQSLLQLEACLNNHKVELLDDKMVSVHVSKLRDNLLEKNILKVVKPYSRIALSAIASRIGLSVEMIQARVGRMILDQIIHAVVDQNTNDLILLAPTQQFTLYSTATTLIEELGKTMECLEDRAAYLNQLV